MEIVEQVLGYKPTERLDDRFGARRFRVEADGGEREVWYWSGLGAEQRERLRQRAGALARVDHPNVARCLSFEEDDHGVGVVFEAVTGESAADQIVRFAVVDPRGAHRFLADALRAAGAFADAGEAHGNINPDSLVWVGERWILTTPWLDPAEPPENDGYLPADHLGDPPDLQADLFSIGRVISHMISHRPPDQFDLSARGLDLDELPVSEPFRDYLYTLIAPRAGDRFPTAEAALRELGPALSTPSWAPYLARLNQFERLQGEVIEGELFLRIAPRVDGLGPTGGDPRLRLLFGFVGSLVGLWLLWSLDPGLRWLLVAAYMVGYLIYKIVETRRAAAPAELRVGAEDWSARRAGLLSQEASGDGPPDVELASIHGRSRTMERDDGRITGRAIVSEIGADSIEIGHGLGAEELHAIADLLVRFDPDEQTLRLEEAHFDAAGEPDTVLEFGEETPVARGESSEHPQSEESAHEA